MTTSTDGTVPSAARARGCTVDPTAGWAVVDPILRAWRDGKGGDLYTYRAGSSGPQAAELLLARSGQQWRIVA
jgi:glucose-6-phosphate 1-dehydrogenase